MAMRYTNNSFRKTNSNGKYYNDDVYEKENISNEEFYNGQLL